MSLSRRQSKGSRGATPDKRRQTIDPEELFALQNDLLNDSSMISADTNFGNSRRSSIRSTASRKSTNSIQSLRKSLQGGKSPRASLSNVLVDESNINFESDLSPRKEFRQEDDRRNTIDNNDLKWLQDEIGKENVSQSTQSSYVEETNNIFIASPSKTNITSTTVSKLDFSLSLSKSNAMMMSPENNSTISLLNLSLPNASAEKSNSTIDARGIDSKLLNSELFDASSSASDGTARRETIDPSWLDSAVLDTSSCASVSSISSNKKSSRSSTKKAAKKEAAEPARRETMDAAWLDAALVDSSNMSLMSSSSDVKDSANDSRRQTMDAAWLDAALETSNNVTPDASITLEVHDTSVLKERDYRRDTIDSIDRNWLLHEVCGSTLEESTLSNSKSSVSRSRSKSRSSSTSSSRRNSKSKEDASIRASMLSLSSSMATDNMSVVNVVEEDDDTDNISVLTMNTMNVVEQVHDLLDQVEESGNKKNSYYRSNNTSNFHEDNDNCSVSEMSLGTVNTMDLMGAVQQAIEEEENNLDRSMDSDVSGVGSTVSLQLQDLLRRPTEATETIASTSDSALMSPPSERKRGKRKSRSPAAASTGISPAMRKTRHSLSLAQSPVVTTTAVNNDSTVDGIDADDSLFHSPTTNSSVSFSLSGIMNNNDNTNVASTPVGIKEINSVMKAALVTGEPVVLRSCLSARKTRPRTNLNNSSIMSASKSVVFGSPNVAEFRKHSPTTSFTPLDRTKAKQLFSMQEPVINEEAVSNEQDEVTAENERILEEWDRLTNASEGNSSDDDGNISRMDENAGLNTNSVMADVADKENADGVFGVSHSKRRNRRRLSKLQPLLELDNEPADESAMSYSQNASACDVSCTVQLPSSMADLIALNDVDVSLSADYKITDTRRFNASAVSQGADMEVSRTVDIEQDLHELMNNLDHKFEQSAVDESNVLVAQKSVNMSQQEPSRTMEIEEDLHHLLHQMNHQMIGDVNTSPTNSRMNTSSNSGVVSEVGDDYNPLAMDGMLNAHSTANEEEEEEMYNKYNRVSLLTSSILPSRFRLSVGSVESEADSRVSGSGGDNIMKSIFGRDTKPAPQEDDGAMDVDDSAISTVKEQIVNVISQNDDNNNDSKLSDISSHSAAVAKSSYDNMNASQSDLEQLIRSSHSSCAASPASAAASMSRSLILGASNVVDDISSNASTVQDDNLNNSASSYNNVELSFIETKKRIVFGSHANVNDSSFSNTAASTSAVNISSTNNNNNALLLQRLQALKEGSRRNTLSQCMTPGLHHHKNRHHSHQQSREYQRLSLQHQQVLLQQQLQITSNNSVTANRASFMPSPIVTRAADKSTLLLDGSIMPCDEDAMDVDHDENVEENIVPSNKSNLDISLLKPSHSVHLENSNILNNNDSFSYREKEEVQQNARLFYQSAQTISQMLLTVDEQLQSVVLQAAQETFALAIKGIVLGFEHLDTELVFSAFSVENEENENAMDEEEYVSRILAAINKQPAPFSEERQTMALLGCIGWEKMWTNLLATAVFELSEALQNLQQSNKMQYNNVFEVSEPEKQQNRLLDKMLNRHTKLTNRRLSGSVLDLSTSLIQQQQLHQPLTFSRFFSIEEYLLSLTADDVIRTGTNHVVSDVPAVTSIKSIEEKAKQTQLDNEGFKLDMWNKIANRMTFLQTREVFEDRVSVIAHLTETVQLSLTFHLMTAENDALLLEELDSELLVNGVAQTQYSGINSNNVSAMNSSVVSDDSSDTRVCTAQENAITVAYFGEFLFPDLQKHQEQSRLMSVSDVPLLLSCVAAHVTVLRKLLCFVRVLHMVGGLVMVASQRRDSAFKLNVDHIDLAEPIAVDLCVLVATLQIPSVFKFLAENKVINVMRTMEIAQAHVDIAEK